MRCIVAGSRYGEITVSHLVPPVLDKLHKKHQFTCILSGNCRNSPDMDGAKWAETQGIPVDFYPADWSLGRGAGIMRNAEMADNADVLVAFWDGKSRGTLHMIETARKKPLAWVYVIYWNGSLEKYEGGVLK